MNRNYSEEHAGRYARIDDTLRRNVPLILAILAGSAAIGAFIFGVTTQQWNLGMFFGVVVVGLAAIRVLIRRS